MTASFRESAVGASRQTKNSLHLRSQSESSGERPVQRTREVGEPAIWVATRI